MAARAKTDRPESTGPGFEGVVERYLGLLGYQDIGQVTMERFLSDHFRGTGVQEEMLATADKGKLVYAKKLRIPNRNNLGGPLSADFVVHDPGKEMPFVAVHSKWQRSAGSVDRKMDADATDAKRAAVPSVFVLGGGGASRRAKQYILNAIDNVTVLALCDGPEEFRVWLDHSWTAKVVGSEPLPLL